MYLPSKLWYDVLVVANSGQIGVIMTVANVLNQVSEAAGSNAKLKVLRENKALPFLRKALEYGLDPYRKFGVVKVPEVTDRPWNANGEPPVWEHFFDVLDSCTSRALTGNAAVGAVYGALRQADESTERWMRRILLKHFNIGVGRKTAFKVYEKLTKTFSVQLAAKWHDRTLEDLPSSIRIEPKLDGVRLVAVVESGNVQMFSRAGKPITNFDSTVGKELATLPDGVYDGEVMDEDFIALMRQVHRKQANVTKSYFMLFDVVTLKEWEERKGTDSLVVRRQKLESLFLGKQFDFLRLIEHKEIEASVEAIMAYHKECVSHGFEGAMLKNPTMPYCFGRSDAVVKVKSFNDADVKVIGFLEGRGRHKGTLGAIIVDYEGHKVRCGSGFGDEQRAEVWSSKDKFLGMTAEVRYQEVTPDGSLRFPVFNCWRLDK